MSDTSPKFNAPMNADTNTDTTVEMGKVIPGPKQDRSQLCIAARDWAEAGYAVFPLKPGTKKPATQNGFKDASKDHQQIDTWWKENPDYNIGIVPASAGLLVIDADPGSEKTLPTLKLPITRAVATPRGGRHFFFRSEEEFGNGSPWDCVDIRSVNGYVVAPPSVVDGKPYRHDGVSGQFEAWECAELPDHIAKALQNHAARQATIDCAGFDWGQRRKPHDGQEPLADGTVTNQLNKEGNRSAIAFSLINKMMQRNYTAEEICETLMHYDGTPVMEHYGYPAHEERVRRDIVRAFQKPAPRRPLASEVFTVPNSDAAAEPMPRRTIRITGGSLPADVADAEDALMEQDVGIFQRGSVIQRLANMPIKVRNGEVVYELGLAEVRASELAELLTSAADWERYDARSQDWRPINCPREVAETLLSHAGRWKLRALTGIINAPTLRPDGTLLDKPGYDRSTGLLLDTRGVAFPDIPAEPSKDDAKHALKVIEDELLGEFPFATAEARAVALAAFLTACIRRTLPTAPLFGIDGTGAGSGKGLLVDTVSVVGIGREAAPINTGASEEELEKRIGAMMLRDDPVISIDNLTAPLDSAFLCSVLTQEKAAIRILGQSKSPTLPTNCMFFATGNGLTIAGDLGRRAVACLIDPRTERPSEAKHTFNPVDRARQDRGRYVAAALTVLRAYQVSGQPAQGGRPLGSFDVWCRTVRDALLWLGEADCAATVTHAADDPDRENFGAVVLSWERVIGAGREVTLKKVVEMALDALTERKDSGLLDALREVARPLDRLQSGIDTHRLGNWLRTKRLQVIHGHRFRPQGMTDGVKRWVLERVQS
jgi:hypothetical protein